MWGDAELHWIILLMNNITDTYHDWSLSTPNFLRFVNDKYSNPDAIHHWEISQTSGDTSKKIDTGGGFVTYSATTTYPPNGIYVEYSNNIYTPAQTTIDNLPTNETYWNQLVATAITNMEYEETIQNDKRKIKILDEQYVELFVENYVKLMEESIL